MPLTNNILVVLNPSTTTQLALEKATFLCERTGGKLTALVSGNNASTEFLKLADSLISNIVTRGIKAELEISIEASTLQAVLSNQKANSYDLTIKEAHSIGLGEKFFRPLDWTLLRSTTTPILLTNKGQMEGEAIVASIDARATDLQHQQLNLQILKVSSTISNILQSPLHLMTAYPAPMQDAAIKQQVGPILEQEYRSACQELASRCCISPNQIHVEPGPAEIVLPRLASQYDAQLLVLGTVARRGLQGVLLGNTAEQILKEVNTDVLVIPLPRAIED